jgi:putative transposase
MDGKDGLFGNVDLQRCHVAHLKADTNAFAERWVRSVKEECLSKLILFGEGSLQRALREFIEHFHRERNHQGKGNVLLFPAVRKNKSEGQIDCHARLGGLLRYYSRAA